MERRGRRAEIAAGLARVHTRINDACIRVARDPAQVRLIVVTKTFPASDVAELAELGVGDVGENRDGEASAKRAEYSRVGLPGLTWHCIGRIQTNKAKSVAAWADVVHSVDSPRLAQALGSGVKRLEEQGLPKVLPCLVQVSLDGDPARGGALITDVPLLADEIAATPGLRIAGVMAVAPLGADPARAFSALAEVSDRLKRSHPQAHWISAGMSGDLEPAVANGATHLRVGGAVLGNRTVLA